jgi:two-component SAPR family response regulator
MESAAVSPNTSRVEVRLLGGFEVRVDGRPVTGFESQKVRGLLAYLVATRGTSHGRERLAELFWPAAACARRSTTCAPPSLMGAIGSRSYRLARR